MIVSRMVRFIIQQWKFPHAVHHKSAITVFDIADDIHRFGKKARSRALQCQTAVIFEL